MNFNNNRQTNVFLKTYKDKISIQFGQTALDIKIFGGGTFPNTFMSDRIFSHTDVLNNYILEFSSHYKTPCVPPVRKAILISYNQNSIGLLASLFCHLSRLLVRLSLCFTKSLLHFISSYFSCPKSPIANLLTSKCFNLQVQIHVYKRFLSHLLALLDPKRVFMDLISSYLSFYGFSSYLPLKYFTVQFSRTVFAIKNYVRRGTNCFWTQSCPIAFFL